MSLVLGVVLGGLSGFYGGIADTIIQRVIEILRSIPTIPLWMGLAAALPRDWTVLQVYFAITIIISLLGWTELARVVRGRFLAMREEDFVVSARLVGCSADAHHLRAHGAVVHEPHHRGHHAGAAGDDHQRDGAELPRAWACGRRRSAGACCCSRRRTSRRSPSRRGSCSRRCR